MGTWSSFAKAPKEWNLKHITDLTSLLSILLSCIVHGEDIPIGWHTENDLLFGERCSS